MVNEYYLVSLNKLPMTQLIAIYYHIIVYHFMRKTGVKVFGRLKIRALTRGKLRLHILKQVKFMKLIVRYVLKYEEIEEKDIL